MPEVPAVSGLAGVTAAVFADAGALARALPDYEPREGQAEMAAAVAGLFEHGGVLLVEAGTGTGKTLGYLVPAILSRQRVLVSTGTKNLQEQIYFKDIPTLRTALDVPFTATYMKGRANYLCLHRLDQLTGNAQAPMGAAHERYGAKASATLRRAQGRAERSRGPSGSGTPRLVDNVFLPIVRDWAAKTDTGDRAELEDLPEDLPFWNEVSATAETCLGTECPRVDECFVTRMRQRAAASDVVIVNHHLLCADASVRQNAYGEVIPGFGHAIIDEAHQLEDVATNYFGYTVSNYRLEDFSRDVERFAASGAVSEPNDRQHIEKALAHVRERASGFFNELAYAHRTNGAATGDADASTRSASSRAQPRDERLRARRSDVERGSERAWGPARTREEQRVRATDQSLANTREAAAYLNGALDAVQATLALLRKKPSVNEDLSTADDAQSLARRAGEIRDELRFLLRASDPEYVYFVEFRGKGVFLRGSPIDVSKIVRELLIDRMRTTVLTSATLTVDGTFEYIRDRLGITRANELRLPSEFDFSSQAILYLPKRMPDPRLPEFAMAAGRQVIDILKRTHGRAFVLFTSYATLRAVQAIAEMALDYPILVQGTAPRSQLLTQFRETPHSVLLATSSFWQGVDVAGEALSCVIVDKLPFASPADPITAARIDAIRARGGEPFAEYQVPLAILTLQQGLGRLIRHRRDRGVLAVLDPRLRTKGYGRRFLGSLPPAPVVQDLSAIEAFFSIV